MRQKLPVNVPDLLHHRRVEGDRIEYKAGWNPDAVVGTLCVFANDFENLDGGYIVMGQDCVDGHPGSRPTKGERISWWNCQFTRSWRE